MDYPPDLDRFAWQPRPELVCVRGSGLTVNPDDVEMVAPKAGNAADDSIKLPYRPPSVAVHLRSKMVARIDVESCEEAQNLAVAIGDELRRSQAKRDALVRARIEAGMKITTH